MFTIDEYEDLLNEVKVKIGPYNIGQGTILRKCEPIGFHIQYNTFCAEQDAAQEKEDAE